MYYYIFFFLILYKSLVKNKNKRKMFFFFFFTQRNDDFFFQFLWEIYFLSNVLMNFSLEIKKKKEDILCSFFIKIVTLQILSRCFPAKTVEKLTRENQRLTITSKLAVGIRNFSVIVVAKNSSSNIISKNTCFQSNVNFYIDELQ